MHVFALLIQHPVFSDTKFLFFFLQIEVLVRNHLSNEVFTIHWHGMHQRNTPWMDGASMISQCPIGPGQSFLYRHVLFCFFFIHARFIYFFLYRHVLFWFFFYTGTFYFGFLLYRHVLFIFFLYMHVLFCFFTQARFILFVFIQAPFINFFLNRHVLFCLFIQACFILASHCFNLRSAIQIWDYSEKLIWCTIYKVHVFISLKQPFWEGIKISNIIVKSYEYSQFYNSDL